MKPHFIGVIDICDLLVLDDQKNLYVLDKKINSLKFYKTQGKQLILNS